MLQVQQGNANSGAADLFQPALTINFSLKSHRTAPVALRMLTSFLDLPLELRITVYRMVCPGHMLTPVRAHLGYTGETAPYGKLLLICRAIHDEAKTYILGNVQIDVTTLSKPLALTTAISVDHRALIQHIRLSWAKCKHWGRRDHGLDSLKSLRSLTVVMNIGIMIGADIEWYLGNRFRRCGKQGTVALLEANERILQYLKQIVGNKLRLGKAERKKLCIEYNAGVACPPLASQVRQRSHR